MHSDDESCLFGPVVEPTGAKGNGVIVPNFNCLYLMVLLNKS